MRTESVLLVLGLIIGSLTVSSRAIAQTQQLPHMSYFGQVVNLNEGDFKNALKGYQSEVRSATKSASSRWVDSICAFTMLGECYYAMGDFNNALENYNAAVNIFVQNPAWMMDTRFPAQGIGPQTNRQISIPWGTGTRSKTLGNIPETFNLLYGNINQYDTVKQGGTVKMARLIPVNLAEIWECTALALYRRYELLGPLCKEDRLTDTVINKLATRPAPPNHWTQSWIDVALGMAYLGAEKYDAAIPLLNRGTVCAGQFDHPLTALAFLALGRQALLAGNSTSAVQFYHEATVAAVCFPKISANCTILEEGFKGLSAAHLSGNPKSPSPALAPAIPWSRTKAGKRLQVVLNTLMAENMLYFNRTADAAKYLGEAKRIINTQRDIGLSAIGAKFNFVTAEMCFQGNQIKEGQQALASALEYMNHGCEHLYQIDVLNNLYQNGKMTVRSDITPRKAMVLYETLLRDPTAADWSLNPMTALAMIACARPISFDNWFLIAMEREEYQKAIMIADYGRRARFYAPMFAGGRLFNLRLALSSPDQGLTPIAKTQRQNVLADFPAYAQLEAQSDKIKQEILKLPQAPAEAADVKSQGKIYEQLDKTSAQQEALLYSMLLRRLPVDPVFPPVFTCEDLQRQLPEGEAALIFYNARGRMFAFLINATQYTTWELKTLPKILMLNKQLHKEMQMIDSNRPLDLSLLTDSWRKTAGLLLTEILKDSKADFTQKFPGLAIVPDDFLWYVPFDLLQVQLPAGRRPLIYQFKIRYAPTASLTVPRPIPTLGNVEWTFAQGRLYPKDDPKTAENAFASIMESQPVKSALTKPLLPAGAQLVYSRLKRLLVWEDLNPDYNKFLQLHPLGIDESKIDGMIGNCMLLPYGAPQMLLLPGFHTPEECSFKQNCVPPGSDIFYTACALMSEGTQTILLSRWRTGGFSAENLLKVFVEATPRLDAASAWQLAVLRTAGLKIEKDKEPRIKADSAEDLPRMTHPLFWGGYLLLDSGVLPSQAEDNGNNGGGIQFKKN